MHRAWYAALVLAADLSVGLGSCGAEIKGAWGATIIAALVAGEAATRAARAWAPRAELLAQSSVAPPASPEQAGSPSSVASPAALSGPGLPPAADQRLGERPPQHPGPAQRSAPGSSQVTAAPPASASAAPKTAPPRTRPNKLASAGSDVQIQVLAGLKAFGGPDLQGVRLDLWGILFLGGCWGVWGVISQAQNLAVVWRALNSLRRLGRRLLVQAHQWRCLMRQPRGALRPRQPDAKPIVAIPPFPARAPSSGSPAPAPSPSQSLAPARAVADAAGPLPDPISAKLPAAGNSTLALREPPRDNPFGDRGRISDPSRFFDREDLLRDIFVELCKGSSLSLVGESQIGKSSLLAMVKQQGPTALARTGKRFIMIDMQSIRDEAEFFEVLCAELGLGQTLRFQGLKRALQDQQVVVCLDEIEKMTLPQAFTWEMRAELRGLAEGQDAPLSLVIASRSPLGDLFPDNPRETSPLDGLCGSPLRVGPFSEAISGAFLRSRLVGHAVQFTERQIAWLHEQSQGHPGRLQSKAAELYRQLVR
jgi:hypothetical protein